MSNPEAPRRPRRPRPEVVKTRIGWREWVALPGLGIERIRAKIDTGARSSCLHAWDIRIVDGVEGKEATFLVHPLRDLNAAVAHCRWPLLDERWVRSSTGHRQRRPVIRVPLHLDGREWPIDLTLTSRDEMGFRMLLGREAFRERFVVDAARSFLVRELVPPRAPRLKPPQKKKAGTRKPG